VFLMSFWCYPMHQKPKCGLRPILTAPFRWCSAVSWGNFCCY